VIELGVLGPLRLQVDGKPVPLRPMLRTLLLALFCERGAVPIDRVGDLLAAPGMPAPSRTTVRTNVSHLRSAIAGASGEGQSLDVLVTATTGITMGYALRLDAMRVDASLFRHCVEAGEQALHAGHYEVAAADAREALSLWRGQPLPEAAERPFALAEIRRQEDLYRRAMIVRVAADVAFKDHQSVITDLEQMVERWPGVLDVRVLLIIALCRSSRHAEAAGACLVAIRVAQELGLSQRRLDALQREVLTETLPAAGLPYVSWGR